MHMVTRVQTNLWEFCSNSCFDFAHSSFGVDVNCQRKTICKCWRLRGRRYCQGHHSSSWTRMSGRKHVSVSKNQESRCRADAKYSNMRGVGQERNEQQESFSSSSLDCFQFAHYLAFSKPQYVALAKFHLPINNIVT